MFEYDPDKSTANLVKHGINFDAAQAIWRDDGRITIPASFGPGGESRFLVVGRIETKLWSAVITMRDDTTRIISVRRARDDEKELYDD